MLSAKIKYILPLVVWLCSLLPNLINGEKLKISNLISKNKEIFFRNLEEGVFGCQLNESQIFLQIFNLSQLCDGVPDCYGGSDENRNLVECTDDCFDLNTGKKGCQNGICINGQCHCNNGFSGCNCDIEDDNECLNRPCDVFAHCTNLVGTYKCTCFPGYEGDGSQCKDIDECADPEIASRCQANSKCCNIPGHYLCKCNEGFRGNGEEYCEDIDECNERADICGEHGICTNTYGNYSCDCANGYRINEQKICETFDQCGCGVDAVCRNNGETSFCECKSGFQLDQNNNCVAVSECDKSLCGPNELCFNTDRGSKCSCLPGFQRNLISNECEDINECNSLEKRACDPNADCLNRNGTFDCVCRTGFQKVHNQSHCSDINECAVVDQSIFNVCGINAKCVNEIGSYRCVCPTGFQGQPQHFCENINECLESPCGVNSECIDTPGSYKCVCQQGYVQLDGKRDSCIRRDVNSLCKSNVDCTSNSVCKDNQCVCNSGFVARGAECLDIDECDDSARCGGNSTCLNTIGGYNCECDHGFIGSPPKTPCMKPCDGIQCGPHSFCKATSATEVYCICDDGWTFNPSRISEGCIDIDECINSPCANNAICVNTLGSFSCQCIDGQLGDPYDNGCVNRTKSNNRCSSRNACDNEFEECSDSGYCVCAAGFIRDLRTDQCRDVDECIEWKHKHKHACGKNAICQNTNGSFDCVCPQNMHGNPFSACEECNSIECECKFPYYIINGRCVLTPCVNDASCANGMKCALVNQENYCVCPQGHRVLSDSTCADIDECSEHKFNCSHGAICINTPGSYVCQCPDGFDGNPYKGHCSLTQKQCFTDNSCAQNEKCSLDANGGKCVCLAPFYRDGDKCLNPCERYKCGLHATCTVGDPAKCTCEQGFTGNPYTGCIDIDECAHNPCSYGAKCINLQGRFECICPKGSSGDPYNNECVLQNTGKDKSECHSDFECSSYEVCKENSCVESCDVLKCGKNAYCDVGDHNAVCKCLDGFHVGLNKTCLSICDGFKCARGAKCIAAEYGATCQCLEGLRGNPFAGGQCMPDKCSARNPCPKPFTCIDGRCKEKCNDQMCGIGASCDPFINSCVCNNNFVGDPMQLCMPPVLPPSCSEDCGDDSHCEYGPTGPRCKSLSLLSCSNQCSPNEVCLLGKCEDLCQNIGCGVNAKCRVVNNKYPQCYCPPEVSRGNPLVECHSGKSDEDEIDCRIYGCGLNAECINIRSKFVCKCDVGTDGDPNVKCYSKNEVSCKVDEDCKIDEVCINSHCIDPCKIRETCGKNAICSTQQHKTYCSCPQCYFGMPNVECRLDPKCSALGRSDQCERKRCEINQKCLVKNKQEVCVCAFGYYVNSRGELVCSEKKVQCQNGFDCPSNRACVDGQCENPCENYQCPTNKTCHVSNRRPICKCNDDDCVASVSICRTDRGCPSHLACRNFRCVNPCTLKTCHQQDDGQFCFVRNHQAVCDQCESGFIRDSQFGCLRVIGLENNCKTNEECNVQSELCIKNQCIKVCTLPCGNNAQCLSKPYQAPKCECLKGFYKFNHSDICVPTEVKCDSNADCSTHLECWNGVCANPCSLRNTCSTSDKCQVYDHEIVCIRDIEKIEHVKDCGYCRHGYVCDERTGQCVKDLNTSLSPTINNIANNYTTIEATTLSLKSTISTHSPPSTFVVDNFSSEFDLDFPLTDNPLVVTSRKMKSDLDNNTEDDIDTFTEYFISGKNSINFLNESNTDLNNSLGITTSIFQDEDILLQTLKPTTIDEEDVGSKTLTVTTEEGFTNTMTTKNDFKITTIMSENMSTESTTISDLLSTNVELTTDKESVTSTEGQLATSTDNSEITTVELDFSTFSNTQNTVTTFSGFNYTVKEVFEDEVPLHVPTSKFLYEPQDNKSTEITSEYLNSFEEFSTTLQPSSHFDLSTQSTTILNSDTISSTFQSITTSTTDQTLTRSDNKQEIQNSSDNNSSTVSMLSILEIMTTKGYRNQIIESSLLNKNKTLIKDVKKIDDSGPNLSDLYHPVLVNKSLVVFVSRKNDADLKLSNLTFNEITNKSCYDHSDCLNIERCLMVRVCNINCTTINDRNCLDTCVNNYSTSNICVHMQRVSCANDKDCADTETCYLSTCKNPCEPDNVCAQNAQCQPKAHRPICTCLEGYKGNPSVQCIRTERLTCTSNSDCDNNQNYCINGLCQNPCIVSNPCSLNADCFASGNGSTCVCKDAYEGDGYNCVPIRKEAICHYNIDCPPTEYCDRLNRVCVNPCTEEECGENSQCFSENHKSVCKCLHGYSGNPYEFCTKDNVVAIEKNPCDNSPCGNGAICHERNGIGSCVCPEGYIGDPYVNCRPECENDVECPTKKACFDGKCKNPCIGQCGINAQCSVREHKFSCHCASGFEGNPFEVCQPIQQVQPVVEKKDNIHPCSISPCGPNSICKVIKNRAVCSCLPNYLGSPPNCRPECQYNSDCPSNKACAHNKCVNPCLNSCGVNALCRISNHNPICSCRHGFTGDPLVNCVLEEKDPCVPSPCGPNTECKSVNGRAACSCLQNYKGRPPHCYPECIADDDCPFNMACETNQCFSPCNREPCGFNAECSVIQHKKTCLCYDGFEGNAQVECTKKKIITELSRNPCDPSPCGINALCRERNGIGSCSCIENYFGNPYVKCKPECVFDTECLKSKACFQNKCVDPCSGACGKNALCQAIDHRPLCSCPEGLTGDPLSFCKSLPVEEKVLNKIDPCIPSPCGPHSQCRSHGDQAVCSCLPQYIGSPPNCRPECSKSSDCASTKACMNYKCVDPCPGICGFNAQCRVIGHSPICSCRPGFNGDPFTKCFPILVEDKELERQDNNPCQPNPCGANSKCTDKDGHPVCSCLKGYLGQPPDCRPECSIHSDCRQNQACIRQKCEDPCISVCGTNAECSVVNHVPICKCLEGFKGDSFVACQKEIIPVQSIPKDKCNPDPCGDNAECNKGVCTCILDYKGDPYQECRPECIVNADCVQTKACIQNKCKNPCDNICGVQATCDTYNHVPICSCPDGFSGDPFYKCEKTAVLKQTSPCSPSPCGPNSQCREQDDRPICSCLSNYNGAPPNCRPECVYNSECSLDTACVNLKCIDTCLGACGFNSECRMVNHNPICSCPKGFSGDPFLQCQKIHAPVEVEKKNPCIPSPCGPNSVCQAIGEKAACACQENYKGSPPNCKPECITNNDCPTNHACINLQCANPCTDLCGINTTCFVRNHNPNCMCLESYEGDPFVECTPKLQEIATEQLNPCEPNPCGENAVCRVQNNAGSCTCMESYTGNPYLRCKPECSVNSDCPLNKNCINNKCQDPCPGTCATNAVCQVVNHRPFCSCNEGYTGDALRFCSQMIENIDRQNVNPCVPSPCGPYSQCKNVNEQAVCSCLPDYLASPPNCRPECTSNSECGSDKSCINRKCVDPCPGTCGVNAECKVIDHSPVCSCRIKYSGDPFTKCLPINVEVLPKEIVDPCIPNPCGPNSKCVERNKHALCTCLEGYKGVAPYCRSECTINSDCPKDLACMNLKCKNPCPGACGINAKCSVINHLANCECLAGYEGNSFISCKKKMAISVERRNKCNPNPCGENADCNDGVCTCILDYGGNPYEGCRPECLVNSDCPHNRACIQTKCQNPCEQSCGLNADCNVLNHIAICTCRDQYDGNPFKICKPTSKVENVRPCSPSPCGANSQCREINGLAVCSCLPQYIGNPPACRPECIYSSDCELEKTCRNYNCMDPCPGSCGIEADCKVINHNPICTCPPGLTGDPFVKCKRIRYEIEDLSRPKDPCNPSPCGLHSKCEVINDVSICSCLPNFIGSPPYCKRECVSHDGCSNDLACMNYKCSNPCLDSCGIQAECYVRNHVANCVCPSKYTGDPNVRCTPIIESKKEIARKSPCEPSPCGINAKCFIEGHSYSCQCPDDYQGDPNTICKPECTMNSDCAYDKACIRMKCSDPCIKTCGNNAQCTVTNHIPNCYCPDGTSGNAFIHCAPIPKIEKTNPCSPSPCGLNSECHIQEDFAACECLPGFFISNDGINCRAECVVSSDCPNHKTCSNQRCVDPCEGLCGIGAICYAVNHNPVCECPQNTHGDPFKFCVKNIDTPKDLCSSSPCGNNGICNERNGVVRCTYPECLTNTDCPQTKTCSNLKCHDPCARACGANALCQVTNHKAYCYCPDNYVGSPKVQCFPKTNIQITAVECNSNADCANDKACVNSKCVSPCDEYQYSCGENAKCFAQMHRALCICPDGYSGNAQIACFKVDCETSYDCPAKKMCQNNECVDPCTYLECGKNAVCKVNSNRQAVCYCPDSYIGNPQTLCKLPECNTNRDCANNLACENNKCVNPCQCGLNAECFVQNHVAVCSCLPGFWGIPEIACDIRKSISKGCRSDSECASKLACIDNECRNPCDVNSPCGTNSVCITVDTLPLRTMSCVCKAGFIGDAYVKCTLGNKERGCDSDFNCQDNQVCLNRECKEVCSLQICGSNADCVGKNHKAVCACRSGFIGDPLRYCAPATPLLKPTCLSDNDCSSDKVCINNDCKDLCAMDNYCGKNAKCEIRGHRPVCKCLSGYAGNPSENCYKVECSSNTDCPYNKVCENKRCIDPCEKTYSKCGRNAECQVKNHVDQCVCPAGSQGNPYSACIAVGCTFSDDCAEDEICERQSGMCKKVCDLDTCTQTAKCVAKNHQAVCECLPGTKLNSYGQCERIEQDSCTTDAECASKLVCIHNKCLDPCSLENMCSGNQECVVTDTLPLRTTICKCPHGTVNEHGICKAIPKSNIECTGNSECQDSHICVNSYCIDACKTDVCGINAICKASNHQANCYCDRNYDGDPNIECLFNGYELPRPKECTRDDDCSYDKSCVNKICTNPCSLDDQCSIDALCRVDHHKVHCSCPNGYKGDPKIQCNPEKSAVQVVECTSHSNCPKDKACMNNVCKDPCNCEPNSICKVINHYPMCYCKDGYVNNPIIGCDKAECTAHEDCADDETCHHHKCVSICLLSNSCNSPYTTCYGKNHQVHCKCRDGFVESSNGLCVRKECNNDNDCTNDKTCLNHNCVNPCTDLEENRCAFNAHCHVQYHKAICYCPPHLPEGNPLEHCFAKLLIENKPECLTDSDCPSKLACIRNQCIQPCKELSPCQPSARCDVMDTGPVRTLICTCPEGWQSKEDGECMEISLKVVGECRSDDDCSFNSTCINRICRNPCNCGLNTECLVQNHRAVCSCKKGYSGYPQIACNKVECTKNADCGSQKACLQQNCIDPCLVNNPCGHNAECYVNNNHEPQCRCLRNYYGDPYEQCLAKECQSSNECSDDKKCVNYRCIDPCVYDNHCSQRAKCLVRNHNALCQCPPGFNGDPLVECRLELQSECKIDSDCPSRLACLNEKCQDICTVHQPCSGTAQCSVLDTLPVRTAICVCPNGFVSDGKGSCRITEPIKLLGECSTDSDCPTEKACMNNICRNPCKCGTNAQCTVRNHRPICSCLEKHEGDPETYCFKTDCVNDHDCSSDHSCQNQKCVSVCFSDNQACGRNAECYSHNHNAVCKCPPGLYGDAKTFCSPKECVYDSECPATKSCYNKKCIDSCSLQHEYCPSSTICKVSNHKAVCVCPEGLIENEYGQCSKLQIECKSDSDCPSQKICMNSLCMNPCNESMPCANNSMCKLLDSNPVKTVICECLAGFEGDALERCNPQPLCEVNRGLIVNDDGQCVCPPGKAFNKDDVCVYCFIDAGYKIDDDQHCVCALEKGFIINEDGECVCPVEMGYRIDNAGNCTKILTVECESDQNCPETKKCINNVCVNPCDYKKCVENAVCHVRDHEPECDCIPGFRGDGDEFCKQIPPSRTSSPPEVVVNCLSDGIQVKIHIVEDEDFNSVFYVKKHSNDERCRKLIDVRSPISNRTEVFKVKFGTCGLVHVNGEAHFILVMQKHPTLVTYKAQAYHIRCIYKPSEQNVTLGFNVSMLTTAGTIANTGPPPTCILRIVTTDGDEINSAEIGEDLALEVEVQPSSIYGGLARNCIAKTTEDNVENEYLVTDENGCATDTAIFNDWQYNRSRRTLRAIFHAFKFPSSDNIRFQCNIRICFGQCQPINCHGRNAFGKRKRRQIESDFTTDEKSLIPKGLLKEEIVVQSNPILTFEKREESLTDTSESTDAQVADDDICVSLWGFLISLILTALLSIVAVAIAVSCWLVAHRRRPILRGPLAHHSEYPNSVFTRSDQTMEPSPDYHR